VPIGLFVLWIAWVLVAAIPQPLSALFGVVVVLIGLGKYTVWAVGRRGLLARSRLRDNGVSVPPEGLVK